MALSASDLKDILKNQQEQFELLLKSLSVGTSTSPNLSLPKFEAFDKGKEKFTQYVERLQHHFDLHDTKDSTTQRACLLASVGASTYQLLKNLYSGEDLTSKTFIELIEKLTIHFKEAVNKHAARYDFNSTDLKPGQTYADWVATLRGLGADCEFACPKAGCSASYIDDMIIDVIIRRTPHAEVRRQCLQDSKLTVDTVIQKAQSYLQTCRSVQVVQGADVSSDCATAATVNRIAPYYNKGKRGKSAANRRSLQFQQGTNTARKVSGQSQQRFSLSKGCPGCYVKHERKDCPANNQICRKCNRKNHFASVCRSQSKGTSNANQISEAELEVHYVSAVVEQVQRKKNQIFIAATVNGKQMYFQWDTGATCSMVGLDGYESIGSPVITATSAILRTYDGHNLSVKGKCTVTVQVGQTTKVLPLFVLNERKYANLLGLPWSDEFGMTQHGLSSLDSSPSETSVFYVSENDKKRKLDEMMLRYSSVFQSGLGLCSKMKAHIQLKNDATPVFRKARPIPFSQKQALQEELNRLEGQGIIEKIAYSDWAVPIVVVSKPNGKLRVCGDFIDVNRQSNTQQHPLPHIDDLCGKISDGKFFTTLDMSDAYFQVELDEESKKICVINTPFGIFKYHRMPFGISSAPSIFQQIMDQMINSLPGTAAFLDDIIVTGRDETEHWENFERVIAALSDFGFRIRPEKCSWVQPKCEYLGFEFSSQGRRPSSSAITAVTSLPRPSSCDEVKAFLGKVGYYSAFIPQMASKAAPLYALLQKNVKFQWKEKEEKAFQELKQIIAEAVSLTHYDPSKQLVLATDASPYGTGAVLSQIEDGEEKPIAFASKTLTAAQKRYSQLDREGLGVIFGVTKFHKFIFGRKFTLQLDNKPLTAIFSPERNIPTMAAQRLTRWSLKLRAYDFEIRFRPTSQHSNADCLSRLPVGPDENFDRIETLEEEETVNLIKNTLFESPIDLTDVIRETEKDKTLTEVKRHIVNSDWPRTRPRDQQLMRYWNLKDSLFIHENAVMLQADAGVRVVIPESLRIDILKTLHVAHFGIVRMKQTLRQYVWWPSANSDVELFCRKCAACRENAVSPPQSYTCWPEPPHVWSRIHMDFAGPFLGRMWLIIIDAKSRFPYLSMMNIGHTTSKKTIAALEQVLAIEGLCDTIITDNGSQFIAEEFENFCSRLGMLHITSPVAHPPSNGLAERFVATFKQHMKKCITSAEPSADELWQTARQVLFMYRTMPHPGLDGLSPAESLHGRKPKNLLSLVSKQRKAEESCPTNRKCQFQVGTHVYYKNYGKGPKWLPGIVIECRGRMVRILQTDRGVVKRHVNQLQMRLVEDEREREESSARDQTFVQPNTDSNVLTQPDITDTPRRNPRRKRDPPIRYGFSD